MVVPVDIWNQRGDASADVTLKWPDNRKPKAAFTVNRTLAAPGSTIKFTNDSSKNATSYKWEFDGATKTTSTAKNPTVTYRKAGTYNVTLTAKNKDGQRHVYNEKAHYDYTESQRYFNLAIQERQDQRLRIHEQ